jgi:hypothetical protein
VITLSLSVAAQNSKAPVLSHHLAGNPSAELPQFDDNPAAADSGVVESRTPPIYDFA